MPKEKHPYIENHFDVSKPWKYLFIGTFPPNKAVREGKKSLTDYFYGNKGFLWKIIGKIYTDFIQKEKAHPSHFLKFLFSNPHCTHFVLPDTKANASQNQKSAIFANSQRTILVMLKASLQTQKRIIN